MIKTVSVEELKKRDFISKRLFDINKRVESVHILGEFNKNANITVVIPTYKRVDRLETCIRSILNQKTEIVFQILVIDNCPEHIVSSDVSDVIKKINCSNILYFVNTQNLGPMGNWNRGFYLAQTEWVTMVHDDDVVNPFWLDKLMSGCEIYSDASCICCKYRSLINESQTDIFMNRTYDVPSFKLVSPKDMLKCFCAPLLGAAIKKDFFQLIGGFVENSTNFEDYVFMMQSCLHGKVYLCNCDLYGYVVDSGNDSNSKGLWDDILIGQYFLRRQVINFLNYNKYLDGFFIKYRLISDAEKHNYKNGILTGFEHTTVDKQYVYNGCELNPLETMFISALVKLRLRFLG